MDEPLKILTLIIVLFIVSPASPAVTLFLHVSRRDRGIRMKAVPGPADKLHPS
jgi:hypothetical protein